MSHILTPAPIRDANGATRRDARPSVALDLTAIGAAVVGAAIASETLFGRRLPDDPDDVVVYLAALSAAVIASWWITNVVAWVIAMRRGTALERFTLPGTKRVAQLLLAFTLTTTACSAGAGNEPTMHLLASAPASTIDTDAAPTTAPPATAAPTTAPPTTAPPAGAPTTTGPATTAGADPLADEIWNQPGWAPSAATSGTIPSTAATSTAITIAEHRVVVADGDNLWTITEAALQHHGLTEPSTADVADYWRAVLSANEVRSGNPNLIVPGESITMPAHTAPPLRALP